MSWNRGLLIASVSLLLLAGQAAAQEQASIPFTRPYPEFKEIALPRPAATVDPAITAKRRIFTYDVWMDEARKMIATGGGILANVRASPTRREYEQAVLRNMPRTLDLERVVLETAQAAREATVAAEAARVRLAKGEISEAEYDRLDALRVAAADRANVANDARRSHFRAANAEQDRILQAQRIESEARMADMQRRMQQISAMSPAVRPSTNQTLTEQFRRREEQQRYLDANRRAAEVYADARELAERESAAYAAMRSGGRSPAELAKAAQTLKAAQIAMFDAREALYATQMANHRRREAQREADIAERLKAMPPEHAAEIRIKRAVMEDEIHELIAAQHRASTVTFDFAEMTAVTNRYVEAQERLAGLFGGPRLIAGAYVFGPTPPPPRPASFPVLPP